MRIISGKFKSRTIKTPPEKFTRPTTDKVKESLFNMLVNSYKFEGTSVLDIYAGSGSLGLEALSRGAEFIHFVELNYRVFRVLSGNIKSLDAEKDCRIFKTSAEKFTSAPAKTSYDFIFADPPFLNDDVHKAVDNILKNGFLAESGVMIIERSIQTEIKDKEAFGREPFRRLGDSLIYLW